MVGTATQPEWVSLKQEGEMYSGIIRTSLSEQRRVYGEVTGMLSQYDGAPFLEGHLGFDERDGLTGSNLGFLILVNKSLAKEGKRTLTFREGNLVRKGYGFGEGYSEYGVALTGEKGINVEYFRAVFDVIKQRGLEFPVIVHPSLLDLGENGIEFLFGKDDSLVVSGQRAREGLGPVSLTTDSLVMGRKYGGAVSYNSGVRRIFESRGDEECVYGGSPWEKGQGGRMMTFVRAGGTMQSLGDEDRRKVESFSKSRTARVIDYLRKVESFSKSKTDRVIDYFKRIKKRNF